MGRRIGQHLERLRQQRIAGKNGGGFVIGAVTGGLAAAQIIVIHGGKVIMNQ